MSGNRPVRRYFASFLIFLKIVSQIFKDLYDVSETLIFKWCHPSDLMSFLIFYLYILKFEQLSSANAILKCNKINSENFQFIFSLFEIESFNRKIKLSNQPFLVSSSMYLTYVIQTLVRDYSNNTSKFPTSTRFKNAVWPINYGNQYQNILFSFNKNKAHLLKGVTSFEAKN